MDDTSKMHELVRLIERSETQLRMLEQMVKTLNNREKEDEMNMRISELLKKKKEIYSALEEICRKNNEENDLVLTKTNTPKK